MSPGLKSSSTLVFSEACGISPVSCDPCSDPGMGLMAVVPRDPNVSGAFSRGSDCTLVPGQVYKQDTLT